MATAEGLCQTHYIDEGRVEAIRRVMPAGGVLASLAETFQALGDPTRLRIVCALSYGELCVCDLAALLSVSISAVSHQLRLLRSLRLVRSRRDGRRIYYTLDDEHIRTLFRQGLDHMEHRTGLALEREGEEIGGHEELAASGAAPGR